MTPTDIITALYPYAFEPLGDRFRHVDVEVQRLGVCWWEGNLRLSRAAWDALLQTEGWTPAHNGLRAVPPIASFFKDDPTSFAAAGQAFFDQAVKDCGGDPVRWRRDLEEE